MNLREGSGWFDVTKMTIFDTKMHIFAILGLFGTTRLICIVSKPTKVVAVFIDNVVFVQKKLGPKFFWSK